MGSKDQESAGRVFLKEESKRGLMVAKCHQVDLSFTSRLGNPEKGKEDGGQRARSQDDRTK